MRPKCAQDGLKPDPKRDENLAKNPDDKNYRKICRPGLHGKLWWWTRAAQWSGKGGDQPNQYPKSSTPMGRGPGEFPTTPLNKILYFLVKKDYCPTTVGRKLCAFLGMKLLAKRKACVEDEETRKPHTPLRILTGFRAKRGSKGKGSLKKQSSSPSVTLIRCLSQNRMWKSFIRNG